MNLGGSMRRSRAGGNSPPTRTGGTKKAGGRGASARRPPRLLLIALGILFGGWATGYLFATQIVFPSADGPEAEYLTVPDLRGLTVSEARALLEEAGLEVQAIDSIQHPDVPSGIIVGQGPLPGQLALLPDSVRLTVSRGAERRMVPEVAGLAGDRALLLLQATGFNVVVDSLESELPLGSAISTSPRAGSERTIPSEVRLAISLGPPFVIMPDLIGVQEEDARAILDGMGLFLATVGERPQLFNPGEVVEQIPAPGTQIPNGSDVSLVISRRRFF